MKAHLITAAMLGLAGIASTAAAQDSETITVQTTVTKYCASLGPAASTSLNLGDLTAGDGELVDDFAGDTDHSVSGYYCNAPARITLAATPLIRTPTAVITDTDNFTGRVDYLAQMNWGSVTLGSSSDAAAPAELDTTVANLGDLIVAVSEPETDGGRRPIAGTYEGAVTLTVTVK